MEGSQRRMTLKNTAIWGSQEVFTVLLSYFRRTPVSEPAEDDLFGAGQMASEAETKKGGGGDGSKGCQFFFGAFCLDVRTLACCPLMGFPLKH